MKPHVDNYKIQAAQAKKLFLTYDQQALIARCRLRFDETFLYTTMLHEPYRIHRQTGDMERLHRGHWTDGNSFAEVMTLLDWLCDCKPDRFLSGRWGNPHGFHRKLQEEDDPNAILFDRDPEAFASACVALGGEKQSGADLSYAIELMDGLRILVQLWHGDDEFSPRLRCLWDENMTQFIRYETSWYALGLLLGRIKEEMAYVQ